MNWHDFVRKYAWDDERTPYLIRPHHLTASQAQKEIFVYALFLGILFFLATLSLLAGARLPSELQPLGGALGGAARVGASPTAALYAASIVGAAIWLGVQKHPHAAIYCASAPVAALFHILGDGPQTLLEPRDKTFLVIFAVLWAWYGLRVIAIARGYGRLPKDEPPEAPPG